jgi:hypothetical protein
MYITANRRGDAAKAMSNDAVKSRAGRLFAVAICILGGALSSCGLGPGALIVAPGTYTPYRCNDLLKQWAALNKREQELRDNMNRASQGGGGTVIGALAYGTDYQTVLTQKKMVQQDAAEKNCELVHNFQSDQTIR